MKLIKKENHDDVRLCSFSSSTTAVRMRIQTRAKAGMQQHHHSVACIVCVAVSLAQGLRPQRAPERLEHRLYARQHFFTQIMKQMAAVLVFISDHVCVVARKRSTQQLIHSKHVGGTSCSDICDHKSRKGNVFASKFPGALSYQPPTARRRRPWLPPATATKKLSVRRTRSTCHKRCLSCQ